MKEERLRILQMVQSQSLSAGEAEMLLAAMGEPGTATTPDVASEAKSASRGAPWRWFRIRVTDASSGRLKTSVKMPFALLDFGLRIGGIAGFDTNELRSAFAEAGESTILEVEDLEDGEHVEIFLE